MNNEFASKELPPEQKRPGFLSALCIIVFIFAGWSLISNLMDAMSPPDPEEIEMGMTEAMDQIESLNSDLSEDMMEGIMHVMIRLVEETRPIALLKAFSAILALAGAFMIWKLKRQGFHLYVIGGLIWAFAPMIFVGANVVTWISAVVYGFVVLVFTIMFYLNRKYMVN